MEINKSNYEIRLIDLLEGTLSEKEAEEVIRFIEQNPHIREEFDDLKSASPELPQNVFKNKRWLLKSASDLPASQFEQLCAAFLENDLQEESKAELREIIDYDPERRKTFDLMSRTKLKAPSVVYKHKNLLIRTTPLLRFTRLALIGLSTAAAIALLVIVFPVNPGNLKDKTGNSALLLPVSPGIKEHYFEIPAGSAIRVFNQVSRRKEKTYVPVQSYTSELPEPDSTETNTTEIIIPDVQVIPPPPVAINLTADLGLWGKNPGSLIPADYTATIEPEVADMSNVARFVTKLFREKILREKAARETPLKGYEIAKAGVTGLNLLFGWEMALVEKNDGKGEPTSVSFSSKILKFNAPLKKTEKQ
jgi:hypothetical protein